MSHYPEGINEAVEVCNAPPININKDRWEETVAFNTEEEFECWRMNHPDCWNVVKILKKEII